VPASADGSASSLERYLVPDPDSSSSRKRLSLPPLSALDAAIVIGFGIVVFGYFYGLGWLVSWSWRLLFGA